MSSAEAEVVYLQRKLAESQDWNTELRKRIAQLESEIMACVECPTCKACAVCAGGHACGGTARDHTACVLDAQRLRIAELEARLATQGNEVS